MFDHNTSKNLRTRIVTITNTAWQLLEPYQDSRAVVAIKNVSSEVVYVSTNLDNASDSTPDNNPPLAAESGWPLQPNEGLSFDKGVAPSILWCKATTGPANVCVISG